MNNSQHLSHSSSLNRDRAEEVMKTQGLSALIATTPENIQYVIGSQLRASNWTMQIYAVLPADRSAKPCIVIPTNRLGVVAQFGITGVDIFAYSDFFVEGSIEGKPSTDDIDLFYSLLQTTVIHPGPVEALKAALKQLEIEDQPIGIDEMRIAPDILARIREELPERSVVSAYKLFRQIRLVKTPFEIEQLRQAAQLNERIEQELIDLIAAGVHEKQLADHYRLAVMRAGGTPAMTAVGAGPRSALPLIENYFHTIETGDQIRFDLCLQLEGYWGDTGRTVVAGEPTAWMKKHFAAVKSGWETALETVRPGVKASEVFHAAVSRVQREGIPHYRRQHVGHAIGLELYDDITLSPGDQRILEPGMVLCVEVPYYELGAGGFQIEDTIVVTPDGYEFLTHMERKLFTK
ncbi:Xaa-Pro aminopeptidase [Paenibacillus xylanexedens]|uniref:M24 family metallopeptidase n=1 Tax=Paenibacillus xylanexedens TaxID=528191 RepID=UPI0020A191EF|nr:Xaa-Pro peptidase family protein [Paenibacillus xylanexedens]MCP1427292.1 Xaa-Pro aminopeptidase [Paenibacillus xylanexedens]